MSKFPLTEKLGLTLIRLEWPKAAFDWTYAVNAAELERILEQAPVVSGFRSKEYGWAYGIEPEPDKDTHTARLLLIEPIDKRVKKSEIDEKLKRGSPTWDDISDLLKRILEHGVEG